MPGAEGFCPGRCARVGKVLGFCSGISRHRQITRQRREAMGEHTAAAFHGCAPLDEDLEVSDVVVGIHGARVNVDELEHLPA